jgi:hypothetical protein
MLRLIGRRLLSGGAPKPVVSPPPPPTSLSTDPSSALDNFRSASLSEEHLRDVAKILDELETGKFVEKDGKAVPVPEDREKAIKNLRWLKKILLVHNSKNSPQKPLSADEQEAKDRALE